MTIYAKLGIISLARFYSEMYLMHPRCIRVLDAEYVDGIFSISVDNKAYRCVTEIQQIFGILSKQSKFQYCYWFIQITDYVT